MIQTIKKLLRKYDEIIRYLIIGVMNTIISMAVYYVCIFTFLDASDSVEHAVANILSWIVGVIFAYVTNRTWVFKSKAENILKEASKFVGGRVGTLLLDIFIMWLLVNVLSGSPVLAKIVSSVIVIITNYILSKFLIFEK